MSLSYLENGFVIHNNENIRSDVIAEIDKKYVSFRINSYIPTLVLLYINKICC